MALKDTSRKPYIQDNDTSVKVGIDLPIRISDTTDGFFATTSTTIEAVKNNIRNKSKFVKIFVISFYQVKKE